MGFLKKSKKAGRAAGAAMASLLGPQEMMVAKGLYDAQLMARVATADNLLRIGQAKQSEDMQAFYQKEVDRIRDDYQRQAKEQTEAYEDECRRIYDERLRRPKTELKKEVIGDVLIMALWVLQNKVGFGREQLHHFLHQFFLLEADLQEPRLALTINDMVNQMKREGWDMQEDIDLIDEMVEAEHERYNDLCGQPYVVRGSIKDKWRPGEEARMKRLLCEGINFLTIGIILGRSEGACKARARKLWGTIDPEQIKKVAA